jgi:hypothetical protein
LGYELYNNKFQEEIKMRTQKLNNLQKIQNSFGRREKNENEKTRKRENVKVRNISFSRFHVFYLSLPACHPSYPLLPPRNLCGTNPHHPEA